MASICKVNDYFKIVIFIKLTLLILVGIPKISRFSKLLLYIFFRISSCNIDFPFIFWLLNSLFCVNGRKLDVFILWIESEKRYSPISFFLVPFWPLVKFIQFIFRKQNAHNFIAEFDSFFLASYNIKKLTFLLLMLMG